MNIKTIQIKNLKDLQDFIALAKEVEGDVIVSKGHFTVDGKSTMGVMSLDISSGCIVKYPEDAINFDNFISKFEVY